MLGGGASSALGGGFRGALSRFGSGAMGTLRGLGGNFASSARAFTPRALGGFFSGSARNIAREFGELGAAGQAGAIGRDVLRGMGSVENAIVPAAVASVWPEHMEDIRNFPTFKPQNMITPLLGGGFD